MFDISWGKLIIIGLVALLVIGPKELPSVLRTVGQWMGKIRRMASEFQGQFQEAMREAEMTDLKKQFEETTSGLQSVLDPTKVTSDIEKLIGDPLAPQDNASATSTPATPPSDPAAPETSATADPVALGTAPVAPAPTADIPVPMPDLPPPPETKDFADAAAALAPSSAPSSAEPASAPTPEASGGKAA